jgi:hypothetical protein
MPVETRAKAAMKEPLERVQDVESQHAGRNVSCIDQEISLQQELIDANRRQEATRRGDRQSHFQQEILNAIGEQRALIIEYKEAHEGQLLELTSELKRLSLNYSKLCVKNNELEQTVLDLRAKIEQLETTNVLNQERLVIVHAGMLASSQEITKAEIRDEVSTAFEEFRNQILHEIKTTRERLGRPGVRQEISATGTIQDTTDLRRQEREYQATTVKAPSSSGVVTPVAVQHLYSTPVASIVPPPTASKITPATTSIMHPEIAIAQPQLGATRPIQKPATFDGRIPWDSYHTQFEIVADINQWTEGEKAAFLASSLKGHALTVLSNLSSEHRSHYPSLVAALESRYGSQRQAELNRMKLRSRSTRREESLPELAEDIERLVKLAYPEATSAVLDTLAKDQFIDALVDDELRLRVAQGRPSTLRAALGVSLEIESFTLAAKRRTRYVRTVQGLSLEEDRSYGGGNVSNTDNVVKENNEFLAEVRLMTAELRKIVSDVNQKKQTREKSPPREKRKCWTCNSEKHVQRDCPTFQRHQHERIQGNEGQSSLQGEGRRYTKKP